MHEPPTLAGAGRDVDCAYYLIHSMGRGAGSGFAERDRHAARAFAERVAGTAPAGSPTSAGSATRPPRRICAAATRRPASSRSKGHRSRTSARRWSSARRASPTGRCATSWRGCRSWSPRRGCETPTQPIGIDDVVEYLRLAPGTPASEGREVQIGGPDVLSYGQMLDRMAGVLQRARR